MNNIYGSAGMTLAHYTRIYEAARKVPGTIERGMTFTAWAQRASITRQALTVLRDEFDRDVSKINQEYRPAAAAGKIQELRDAYDEIVNVAKRKVEDDLSRVTAAAKHALQQAMNAPSSAMCNILTVTGMRKNLTPVELAYVAEQLQGNLHALAALHDIAEKHGLDFPAISIETEEEKISTAEDAARKLINSIATPTEQLHSSCFAFWQRGAGVYPLAFQAVDEGFTAPRTTSNQA